MKMHPCLDQTMTCFSVRVEYGCLKMYLWKNFYLDTSFSVNLPSYVSYRSVLSIALIKHGGPKQLRLAMTRPCSRVGDHCHEQVWRLEEVNKMVDKLDLSEQDKMLVKIPFPGTMQRIVKKKGAASVREACARMEQYERLMDALPDRDKAIMKRADLRGIYLYADLIHQDWWAHYALIKDLESRLPCALTWLKLASQNTWRLAFWEYLKLAAKKVVVKLVLERPNCPLRFASWALWQCRYNSFNQITHNLVATQESYDASTELLKMIAPINVDKLDGLRRKHHASTHLGSGLQALLTYLRPANKKAMRQRQLTEALSRHNLLPRSDSRLCRLVFVKPRLFTPNQRTHHSIRLFACQCSKLNSPGQEMQWISSTMLAWLCRAYTNEEEPFPLEEISNMMQEMNWLVAQTTYQEEFASRIKQRANNSDAEYNRISKLAKRAALQVWTWKKSAIPADIRSRFEDSAFVWCHGFAFMGKAIIQFFATYTAVSCNLYRRAVNTLFFPSLTLGFFCFFSHRCWHQNQARKWSSLAVSPMCCYIARLYHWGRKCKHGWKYTGFMLELLTVVAPQIAWAPWCKLVNITHNLASSMHMRGALSQQCRL